MHQKRSKKFFFAPILMNIFFAYVSDDSKKIKICRIKMRKKKFGKKSTKLNLCSGGTDPYAPMGALPPGLGRFGIKSS